MSGNNKWSKIKHKKESADAEKSRVFSKFVKLIQVESKKSKGDKNSPALRSAINKAKGENMPMDNIERAIAKGKTGACTDMEYVIFESYGYGGSAIIIEGLTDNNNRTAPEIRNIFHKAGLALGGPGSATWAFNKTADGYEPQNPMELSDEDGEKLADLIERLEDQDDVQGVFTTADTPEESE